MGCTSSSPNSKRAQTISSASHPQISPADNCEAAAADSSEAAAAADRCRLTARTLMPALRLDADRTRALLLGARDPGCPLSSLDKDLVRTIHLVLCPPQRVLQYLTESRRLLSESKGGLCPSITAEVMRATIKAVSSRLIELQCSDSDTFEAAVDGIEQLRTGLERCNNSPKLHVASSTLAASVQTPTQSILQAELNSARERERRQDLQGALTQLDKAYETWFERLTRPAQDVGPNIDSQLQARRESEQKDMWLVLQDIRNQIFEWNKFIDARIVIDNSKRNNES